LSKKQKAESKDKYVVPFNCRITNDLKHIISGGFFKRGDEDAQIIYPQACHSDFTRRQGFSVMVSGKKGKKVKY
jgi:hypothetical protein